MTAGWVAGHVRAEAMLNRRVGAGQARVIAGCGSLEAAQRLLGESAYRGQIQVGQTLGESEYGLASALLWRLRVLAGWQPPRGASAIRALASGFEVANIDGHARVLSGRSASRPPFTLGGLAVAWSRLGATGSLAELRAVLAASPWGDPGGQRPADIAVAVRLAWARAVAAAAPAATRWAAGGAALVVVRRVLIEHEPLTDPARRQAAAILGAVASEADEIGVFIAALPMNARWALADVSGVDGLWRAEFEWWRRLDNDAQALLTGARFDAATPIAAAALLAVDAWRCRAALQVAAGTGPNLEDYDALV